MAEELCRATYMAHQIADTIVLIAFGKHSTSGYQVRFQDTPIAVFPPEYRLEHTAPSGPVTEVETEFLAYTAFPASAPVQAVIVHDADGRHEVEVRQASARLTVCRLPGDPTTKPPTRPPTKPPK